MTASRKFLILLILQWLAISSGSYARDMARSQDIASKKGFDDRIAEAIKIETPEIRDSTLIEIALDQLEAKLYSDAKATISNYVQDKGRGFASLVTALSQAGSYDEAERIVGLIENVERRAIAWRQVAEIQLQNGSVDASRETLRKGLNDITREGESPAMRASLYAIVSGMAEASMDSDVWSALKLFGRDDLYEAYLTVAGAYLRRGKKNEAMNILQEAVKHEQHNSDPVSSDNHLEHIAEIQAGAGSLIAAKETALKIKDVARRNTVLGNISATSGAKK